MKNKLLKVSIVLCAIMLPAFLQAQDWVSMMMNPEVNFHDVQKEFNKYAQAKKAENDQKKASMPWIKKLFKPEDGEESEISGYTQFKRWEWFMAPRVNSDGSRFNPAQAWIEMDKYKKQFPSVMAAGNWTFMGPTYSNNLAGAGRLNFVRLDPTNSNIIYTGSPSGGLWKSVDGGNTWATNTDNLNHVIGCTDIAIDPNNTNIMYLATGDGDAGDNYSVGLLKTTDGGTTWNTTGLSFAMGNYRQLSKVLIDPNNTNTILVAASSGVYRSTDAGATFSVVQTGSFKDMEFKAGDPNSVYACGGEFYRSSDNGQTWTKTTSGLPVVTNVSRMAIAVTLADPDLIYMIVGLPAPNYGTEGFYKSTNGGASFTKIGTPNIGTQQWYDLAVAASPTNSQEVVLGGQTQFLRSTNGGSTWNNAGGIMHVDYHDIIFVNSTTYYVANDGGIYRTTNNGSSYTNLNNNIAIAQMYGFGQSVTDPNLHIQGWQDNGTNLFDGTWSQTMGGDGMLAFISHANDNNMWGSQYEGSLNRSTNGGNSWSGATAGITEVGAWVTPWIEDPVTANTLWAGFINVYKSTNGGASWTKKSTFQNQATLNAIAVSPANNQVIWAAKSGNLYRSTDGATTWTIIANVPPGTITGIACSNTDENKAWITYSGFSNKYKVFQTTDQGATWTNLSGSIPNIPVNCITYMNGSNDALYIGTDVGVFYKDASLNIWQPFYGGLPNVVVTQLNIFYPTGKIRASTYGRGMWESDLYVPGAYPPAAAFDTDKKIDCPGAAIQYYDYSSGQPTAWNWTFTGGSPSTSTDQNPVVYYNTPGTYSASLVVTNVNGIDSTSFTNLISISSSSVNNPTTVGDVRCGPGVVNLSATGSGTGTLRWWDAPGGGNIVATGNTYSPSITNSTTYYVDEDFPSGNQDFTGENSNAIGAGAYFTANDIRGLYFDVINPVVLNTVEVYSAAAGDRTIEVLDANGNTYCDTTVFIPASPNQTTTVLVTLNFKLYPGTNYFIKCRGLVNLYRNSSGAIYPYLGNSCIVTNSNAGSPGYYYFFYNWVLTEIACNTGRTPVSGVDTCSVQGIDNLESADALSVFPNPSNGVFSLDYTTSVKDNYQVKIMNAAGELVYFEKLDSFSGELKKQIDISKFGSGVYMLSIINSKNEIIRKIMVY